MAAHDHVFDPSALAAEPEGEGGTDGPSELQLEPSLRPRSLDEFVGQERVKENLRVALTAARGRGEAPDHVLLSGPPGLGKTSLARVLATELGTRLHATAGPALERPRDLVGLLTQLEPGDVFFIDEVHRIPATVEEYLYTAMEDFRIDFTLDQGPHARVMTLDIKPFVMVGATTREGLLSAPFRARFGLLERLRPYATSELVRILERAARILEVEVDAASSELLASRARGTPRIANRFLRWARDLAAVRGRRTVDLDLARESLERHGVDEHGLEDMDRRILRCLARNGAQPTGIKTIAAAVGESEDTIEEVFEPHLLQCDFLLKTSRGRQITERGLALLVDGLGASPRVEPYRTTQEGLFR
jgi:Holliday junction DNA helicase RuvB